MNKADYDEQDDFEIVDHGMELGDYFQGCGVAFTKWQHVVTGVGESAIAAYDDAVEQIAMGYQDTTIVETFPETLDWLSDEVDSRMEDEDCADWWYRVSIRWGKKL